jgi:hypothetical protein
VRLRASRRHVVLKAKRSTGKNRLTRLLVVRVVAGCAGSQRHVGRARLPRRRSQRRHDNSEVAPMALPAFPAGSTFWDVDGVWVVVLQARLRRGGRQGVRRPLTGRSPVPNLVDRSQRNRAALRSGVSRRLRAIDFVQGRAVTLERRGGCVCSSRMRARKRTTNIAPFRSPVFWMRLEPGRPLGCHF